MPRGVCIALPAYDGTVRVETAIALTNSVSAMQSRGWVVGIRTQINCSILPLMRNQFVADFLRHPQFDDLFMLDNDVDFPHENMMRVLDAPGDVVAGVYPKRQDELAFPVRSLDGATVDINGMLEVEAVPAGFMRMTRRCLQSMVFHYAESYEDNCLDTKQAWDLFGQIKIGDRQYWGEDFSFCHRWRQMGGKIHTIPELQFTHWGPKGFAGKMSDILEKPEARPLAVVG